MNRLVQHIKDKLSPFLNKHLFVACSGGLDSVVLTHILHQFHKDLRIIHVNYHLRGEDSNEDARFVQRFTQELDIPFQLREVELQKQLEDGGNLQELARDFRYNWFKEITADHQDNYVVLAHHSNDQVETFFLNLARKSGIMGLSCMPFQRNQILRPLLSFTKDELREYAIEHNLSWREDVSNASNKYRRNLVRNELLPGLESDVPQLQPSVLLLIERFQETQQELQQSMSALRKVIEASKTIKLEKLKQLSVFELTELFRQWEQPFSIVQKVLNLIEGSRGKKVELIASKNCAFKFIVRDFDQLSFVGETAPTSKLTIEKVSSLPLTFDKKAVYLNAQKIQGELKIRSWKEGDRIFPIGMNGSQLISDIIYKAKVPAFEKEHIQVLVDDCNIHWCVGLKVGRKAIATEDSEEILKVEVNTTWTV